MPSRALVSEKMAELLSAISHPQRIKLIEELYSGEKAVNTLKDIIGISHSSVSQHLSTLKAQKIVKSRKEKTRVFYCLTQPDLANWLLLGLVYIDGGMQTEQALRSAVKEARIIWGQLPENE